MFVACWSFIAIGVESIVFFFPRNPFAKPEDKDMGKEVAGTTEVVGSSLDVEIEMEPKEEDGKPPEMPSPLSSLSKLGLVTSDCGIHTVKLPSQQRTRSETVDSVFEEPEPTDEPGRDVETPSQLSRKKRLSRSSATRRERWQSTQQHVEERKLHFERRMTQVRKMARRVSVMHPPSTPARLRRLSTKERPMRRQTTSGYDSETAPKVIILLSVVGI